MYNIYAIDLNINNLPNALECQTVLTADTEAIDNITLMKYPRPAFIYNSIITALVENEWVKFNNALYAIKYDTYGNILFGVKANAS